MLKKIVSIALLALVPIVSIQADSNITKDPFANDPVFKEFQKLQQDMNKIFENFHKQFFSDMSVPQIPTNIMDSGFSISVRTDVVDKGDHYELTIKISKAAKTDLDVKTDNGVLSIKVTQSSEVDKKDKNQMFKSHSVSSYIQSFTLPKDADANKISHKMEDDKIIVTIPKKKA